MKAILTASLNCKFMEFCGGIEQIHSSRKSLDFYLRRRNNYLHIFP